jgi:hypothetical protein
MLVNFVKTIFSGPETLQEAQAKISVAVETYTSTIVDLGASIGIQLFKQGKKIEEKIDNLSTQFEQFFMSVDNRFSGNFPVIFEKLMSQSKRNVLKKSVSKHGFHTRREQTQPRRSRISVSSARALHRGYWTILTSSPGSLRKKAIVICYGFLVQQDLANPCSPRI